MALSCVTALINVDDASSADINRPKRVLIVSTGSSFAPGFTLAAQTATDTLRQLESAPLELYSESLDIVRFPSDSYSRLFRNYLGEKYVDYPPDVVLLIYVGNLGLAEKLLKELFPEVPIVVMGLTEEKISPAQLGSPVTGLAQRSDPTGTIELMLRLRPETRRIVVIGGTAEVDTEVISRVREAARPMTGRAEFDFWTNRSMSELTQTVKSLPPQTAILFTRMFRDGAGQAFNSAQAVKLIAEAANVPVYIMTDTLFGSGAVGGSVIDVAALARRAGEMAHHILSGAAPNSLPFEIRTDGVPTFDWRALKRWSINESRLPPGSILSNRPRSVWAQYRWYIIGALAIMALQAALIVGLILEQRRRRRIEAELRENQELMELATGAAGLGLWARDLNGDVVWANAVLHTLLGIDSNEPVRAGDLFAQIHPEDRARVKAEVQRAQDADALFEGEFRTQLADGRERWVLAKGASVSAHIGGAVRRMGVLLDVTERKKMELELRESEERFRMMADTAPVMIWMSGLDRLCTFFNKGWLDFTGRAIDQELGNGWTEGVHPEDYDRCLAVYVSSFDGRQEFTMEYRLRRSDGEYCWMFDHGVPRFEADGSFLGYIGTATDISEIKRGEERFRLAVEASSNATVMVNDQGRIVLVNRQTETLFGYSREELIGRPVEILVPERFRIDHPDHRGRFIAAPEKRVMGDGRVLYGRRKDGSEVLVEIGLNPIYTREGLLVLTSIVDISTRKEAEEALEKEHRFLRQVIDVDPNFVFAKDREGRFTLVNQSVADAYGTTVEELIGKTDADFNPNRDEVESFHRMDLQVIDNLQELFIGEEQLTDAKGNIRWLQTIKRPIVGKDGVADQVLGASTDITRRKQAETELQLQRNELAHVTRVSLMGELAASLAHELNQPLTAILSNAQAAQRFLLNQNFNLDEVREILTDIVEDNNRAGDIIRKIRALVRKEELTLVQLDLTAVIRDVVSLVHSDATLRNVRVDYQAGDSVPPVRGDKIQLQQVMINLLLNAFDAMKDYPTAERQVWVRAKYDDVGIVEVSVRDRGTGLTSDKLDRIFEPFFTTKKDGLGMGLSISRSIVEAHGGHLWAESNQDRGVTFHLVLPIFSAADKNPNLRL